MTIKLWFIVLASLLGACSEDNPYKGQYRSQPAQASSADAQGPGNVNQAREEAAEEAATVADEEAIAEEDLNTVQLVCQNQEMATKYPVETGALCLNGQPTNAFANALASPYQGGDNANLGVIKSEDVNGISHFILLAAIELPLPLSEVYAQRAALNPLNFTEGNATIAQVQLAELPAQGGAQLGGFDLQFDLTVRVAIITVQEQRILQRDFIALDPEQNVIASATYMKPGAEGNNPATVANLISFWIADGEKTKLVTVTHQQAENRGQHPTAETTILGIGRRTMVDTYNLFTQ
ncbi:MAG: hypothetical protein ACOH5I_13945 [Oligoflexus sp.]